MPSAPFSNSSSAAALSLTAKPRCRSPAMASTATISPREVQEVDLVDQIDQDRPATGLASARAQALK